MVRRINRIAFDRLTPESSCVLGPYAPPIARVSPGEEVEIETWDCYGGTVKPGQTRQQAIERGIKTLTNPVTGPIYVEGAEPGDALQVTVLGIDLPERGYTGLGHGVSPLGLHVEQPKARHVEIIGGKVHYVTDKGRDLAIEAEPFVGTIGVSPASEAVSTTTPGHHGGNMDCPDIRAGNTLTLSVSRPGALFGLGDVHALQGDGEVSGTAVEVEATVKLRFDLKKAAKITWPRVESPDEIMTVCSSKPLEDAARLAYRELIGWMTRDYGFSRDDAHLLLSLVGKARIAQIVDPLYTVVAKVAKRHLKE
jgi:acetamidase/formamidase